MDFDDIQEKLNDVIQDLHSKCRHVPAEELGLDRRCGYVFLGKDFIATSNPRMLDYYGGFEYVDQEYIISAGIHKIYSAEDERVQGCIERYNNDDVDEDTENE